MTVTEMAILIQTELLRHLDDSGEAISLPDDAIAVYVEEANRTILCSRIAEVILQARERTP